MYRSTAPEYDMFPIDAPCTLQNSPGYTGSSGSMIFRPGGQGNLEGRVLVRCEVEDAKGGREVDVPDEDVHHGC